FHGQTGPRSDREMGSTQGIAHKHNVIETPVLVPDYRKITPIRMVAYDGVSFEFRRKYPLAIGNCVFGTHGIESGTMPGVFCDFDQKCAHVGSIPVMMCTKYALVRLSKRQGQTVERLGRAIPDELVRTDVGSGSQFFFILGAYPRRNTIGGNDQIGRAQLLKV